VRFWGGSESVMCESSVGTGVLSAHYCLIGSQPEVGIDTCK
jgi:hypothetical protein